MHSKIKVGIAGYGVVGKKRGECISKNQNLELVAVCDRNFESTGKFDDGVYFYPDYPLLAEVYLREKSQNRKKRKSCKTIRVLLFLTLRLSL